MTLLYALLAGEIMASALLILSTPHVLYAILGLLCMLLGIACTYCLQGAAFVAVAHVAVYGGAAVVMLLWSTLMLPHNTQPTSTHPKWRFGVLVVGLAGCLWPLVRAAVYTLQQRGAVAPLPADATTGLGLQLLGPYALAFEWVGLNLLVALVGATHIMKEK